MRPTRRDVLRGAAAGGIALATSGIGSAGESREGPRFGMCDWSLGRWDPSVYDLAHEIGLDGVQVSLGRSAGDMHLRKSETQKAYLEAARRHGMGVASLALGILNDVPLMSEPRAAIWVADAIDVMPKMGTDQCLLAFFGKGELKEENKDDMRRVTDVLIELAPRAEKAGVVLALETYLSADAHLKIIEVVKSRAIQVYYDVYNSCVTKKHDPQKDIQALGRHICQVHLKEGPAYLGASGQIDWPAVAGMLQDVGYKGWLVLETSAPSKDIVADTKRNLAFAKKAFGVS